MSIKLKFFLGFLACILLSILSISGIALQKILSVSESSFEGAAGKQLELADKYVRNMFAGNLSKMRFLAQSPKVLECAASFPTPKETKAAGKYDAASLPQEAQALIAELARMKAASPQISKIFIGYRPAALRRPPSPVMTPPRAAGLRTCFPAATQATSAKRIPRSAGRSWCPSACGRKGRRPRGERRS